jgi:hypothetical protein
VFVRKIDGSQQPFDKDRVIMTCLRNGASKEAAFKIADRIEEAAYEGMRTKEILTLIWKHLGDYHPETQTRIDLRTALSLLRPPDFEEYASLIMKDLGYSVQTNVILRGKCVEHEIDVIAQKNNLSTFVEVKHHNRPHTYTPLDVPMKVWATLQDVNEGRKLGYHNVEFTSALVVCNTKFTDHARAYANCVGIEHLCWKSPPQNGIDDVIRQRSLYPVTMLKEVDRRLLRLLVENGIVLLKQLVHEDAEIMVKSRLISNNQLSSLRNVSRNVLSKLDR